MTNFKYSDDGIKLTQEFEGLSLSAYTDQKGVWTIGYGHTGLGVHGGLKISQEQANIFLDSDIAASVACVNRLVTGTIVQCQFDALVDFTFNLGCASLAISTLLRAVNAADFETAASEFLKWDHVQGQVIQGLLVRRKAEAALFSQNQPDTVVSATDPAAVSIDVAPTPAGSGY